MKTIQNIFALLFLTGMMATALAFTPYKNGKVIMVITLEVKSFTDWEKGFDAGAPVREKAGIKVISICSTPENENKIMVIEEAENAQVAHSFLSMLKAKQKEGGLNNMVVKLYDKAD